MKTKTYPINLTSHEVSSIRTNKAKTQLRREIKGDVLNAIHVSVGDDNEIGSSAPETSDLGVIWDGRNVRFYSSDYPEEGCVENPSPYCVGDTLWVREAFLPDPSADSDHWEDDDSKHTYYSWDGCGAKLSELPKALRTKDNVFYEQGTKSPEMWNWRTPSSMPRWASRILLEITAVRIERLHEITRKDAIAEGIYCLPATGRYTHVEGGQYFGFAFGSYQESLEFSWEFIAPGIWHKNPWVWVVEFKVLEGGAA